MRNEKNRKTVTSYIIPRRRIRRIPGIEESY